ncbi:MAG TPA: glycerol-3-phosphate acyltransferase [Candidatus Dormibacteraeota bacterium]|nr:glycerol-3-phosphate acyltransferase [Candidatus Dormibacteraeota bacterium]
MATAGPWFVAGYLIGSVPIGLLVGRLAGKDIRRYGTGNIGASNVLRNLGPLPAAVVGVSSFVQGFAPAWTAGELTGSPLAVAAAAVGSVIGYGWSFLLAFRGGRAVGVATGALAALAPAGLIPLLGMYALGGLLRQPAPGVLLGLLSFLVYLAAWPHPTTLVVAAVLIVAAVVLKRLDGVRDDLRAPGGRPADILFDRLVFDRRPGQRLVGPNDGA